MQRPALDFGCNHVCVCPMAFGYGLPLKYNEYVCTASFCNPVETPGGFWVAPVVGIKEWPQQSNVGGVAENSIVIILSKLY